MLKYLKEAYGTVQGKVHTFMTAVCIVLMLILPYLIHNTRVLSVFVIALGFLAFQNTNQFFALVNQLQEQGEKNRKGKKKK